MTIKLTRCKRDKDLFWYKDTDGKKKYAYRYRYKDAFGKQREKSKRGFKSETTAYRELLNIKALILEESYNEVDHSNMTVTQWTDLYIESKEKEWKEKTRINRVLYAEKHIKPRVGHFKLAKLDRVTYVNQFINPMLDKYAPGSVRTIHDFFKQVINAAVDAEILRRNRFTKIQIKDTAHTEMNVLDAAQLAAVIKAMKEHEDRTAYLTTLLLAYTGMRIGEALGLQWNDVDFEENTISINKTRDRLGTRTPKTENSYRTIGVPKEVMDELSQYKTVCKKIHLKNGIKFKESLFILTSIESGILYGTTVYGTALKRTSKRLGLTVKAHTFRHTYATLAILNGEDVVTVAAVLGNSATMVLKVYAHAIEQRKSKTVNVITKAIANH